MQYIMNIIMILFLKKKYGMLEIFMEILGKDKNLMIPPENKSTVTASEIKIFMDFVRKCVIDMEILNDDDMKIIDDMSWSGFFYTSPSYYAMITDNIEGFRRNIDEDLIHNNAQLYLLSAITFRNTEILKILFEKGKRLTLDIEETAYLYMEEGRAEYLLENFSEYIFKFENFDEQSPKASVQDLIFIQYAADDSEMLRFAKKLCEFAGEERFREVVRGLPKISELIEFDLPLTIRKNSALREIFADTLTIYIGDGYHLIEMLDVDGIDVVCDFSNMNGACFEFNSVPEIIRFIKRYKLRFSKEVWLHIIIRDMLRRNDDGLTRAMVSAGLINKDNLEDVIDELCWQKLYIALNAVNQSEISEAENF